jgi:hypothetical protein
MTQPDDDKNIPQTDRLSGDISDTPLPEQGKGESNEDILASKVASGVATRGGGHRIARAMNKANRWFGFIDQEDEKAISQLEGSGEPQPEKPLPPKTRRIVLGRGALAAILALIFTVPIIIWLGLWAFDLNGQIDNVKSLNKRIQEQQAGQNTALVSLLNSPTINTYKMANVDPVPEVEVNLHIGGPRLWFVSARQTTAILEKERVLVLYAVRRVTAPGSNDYVPLAVMGGGSNTLTYIEQIPSDFSAQKYVQLIITDEPITQEIKGKPTGIIRFSLDVQKITVPGA